MPSCALPPSLRHQLAVLSWPLPSVAVVSLHQASSSASPFQPENKSIEYFTIIGEKLRFCQGLLVMMPDSHTYRILLNKRTLRVEFGKIFCRRGVVKHPYNRTPE